MGIGEFIKSADFKSEKHVPVIEIIKKDESSIKVGVKVGKEIAHPNTKEHYIAWIALYYKAEGAPLAEVGRTEFKAHGEGDIYAEPSSSFRIKGVKSGKLIAVSYCNLHGLWESEIDL